MMRLQEEADQLEELASMVAGREQMQGHAGIQDEGLVHFGEHHG